MPIHVINKSTFAIMDTSGDYGTLFVYHSDDKPLEIISKNYNMYSTSKDNLNGYFVHNNFYEKRIKEIMININMIFKKAVEKDKKISIEGVISNLSKDDYKDLLLKKERILGVDVLFYMDPIFNYDDTNNKNNEEGSAKRFIKHLEKFNSREESPFKGLALSITSDPKVLSIYSGYTINKKDKVSIENSNLAISMASNQIQNFIDISISKLTTEFHQHRLSDVAASFKANAVNILNRH